MSKSKKTSVDRRGFLKGAATGAAVLVTKPQLADAQEAAAQNPQQTAQAQDHGQRHQAPHDHDDAHDGRRPHDPQRLVA